MNKTNRQVDAFFNKLSFKQQQRLVKRMIRSGHLKIDVEPDLNQDPLTGGWQSVVEVLIAILMFSILFLLVVVYKGGM